MRRLGPVLLVLVLAPITAEYLIGYDDTVGNAFALLFGILVFGPLYGAPAVLIRELVVRRGLGWPSILLLATGFGLVQAGLVDQSLFNPDYRGIPYWHAMRHATFLPGLGTSAYMAIAFVGGHVLGSIAAPIAMAESWWPERSGRSWLRAPGLTVMVALWGLGVWLVLADTFSGETFRISPMQLVGTVAVVVALALLALTRRPALRRRGQVPAPWVVFLVSVVLLVVRNLTGFDWVGTVVGVASVVVWLALIGRWYRRTGWTARHLVAALAGDLVAIGGPAFLTTPLGDVGELAKLVTNIVLLGGVLLLAWRGWVVSGPGRPGPAAGSPAGTAA